MVSPFRAVLGDWRERTVTDLRPQRNAGRGSPLASTWCPSPQHHLLPNNFETKYQEEDNILKDIAALWPQRGSHAPPQTSPILLLLPDFNNYVMNICGWVLDIF